jgi:hypothetical protein
MFGLYLLFDLCSSLSSLVHSRSILCALPPHLDHSFLHLHHGPCPILWAIPNVVLDATITDDLLALFVLFCSNVMSKIIELLADLVALYLSRNRSVRR